MLRCISQKWKTYGMNMPLIALDTLVENVLGEVWMKNLDNFFQYEYLMSFLMVLNEPYGHSHSQILLMDPTTSINKVVSLIAQEEQ